MAYYGNQTHEKIIYQFLPLTNLDEREKFVIGHRIADYSLHNTAERLELSDEMVRQIEKKALKKLRKYFLNVPKG